MNEETRKPPNLDAATEEVQVNDISDVANLGVDTINVVSTEADDAAMDSHEYTTVPEKLSSPRTQNMYSVPVKSKGDKTTTDGAAASNNIVNGFSSENVNAYSADRNMRTIA